MRFTYLWGRSRRIDGVEVGADHGPERRGLPSEDRHGEGCARTCASKQRGRDAIGAEKRSRSARMVFELTRRAAAQRRRRGTSSHFWWCKACSVLEAEQTDELECDHSSRVWAVRSLWWWEEYEATSWPSRYSSHALKALCARAWCRLACKQTVVRRGTARAAQLQACLLAGCNTLAKIGAKRECRRAYAIAATHQ